MIDLMEEERLPSGDEREALVFPTIPSGGPGGTKKPPRGTVEGDYPARTRTWNDWTKTSCVANYTTG